MLIVSTVVGRGMHYIGEAIKERFQDQFKIYHSSIEEFLPPAALAEDYKRYYIISNHFPFLLNLVYKIPIFYYRKYLKEMLFARADLGMLQRRIEELNIKTVICVSHRPAFWVSALKRRKKASFRVWGVHGEFGRNLGWEHIFWNEMDGFLIPVDMWMKNAAFYSRLKVFKINLPARLSYYEIAESKADKNKVLLVCGFWGQGPIIKILKLLLKEIPQIKIYAVCGENTKVYYDARTYFKDTPAVEVYGVVDSLAPFLKDCASIITKPGISTIIESHAAQRKMFLLKGMPVAEDNNAHFAIKHFGAEWFEIKKFKDWRFRSENI